MCVRDCLANVAQLAHSVVIHVRRVINSARFTPRVIIQSDDHLKGTVSDNVCKRSFLKSDLHEVK